LRLKFAFLPLIKNIILLVTLIYHKNNS